jgi:activator of HSP90 ATPase
MKTRDLIQEIYFKCDPEKIYGALMNSKQHEEFTGSFAEIDPQLEGKFNCYDGYITGKTIFLEEGLMIIQEWRANEIDWPDYHYSTVQFKFKPLDGGTHLTFIHKGIPEVYYESISNGWYEHYWEPLKRFLVA